MLSSVCIFGFRPRSYRIRRLRNSQNLRKKYSKSCNILKHLAFPRRSARSQKKTIMPLAQRRTQLRKILKWRSDTFLREYSFIKDDINELHKHVKSLRSYSEKQRRITSKVILKHLADFTKKVGTSIMEGASHRVDCNFEDRVLYSIAVECSIECN